jgi:exonuclease SbcD
VRFLHTGDWHLGRTIRGRSRIDESARVLDEVAGIARDEGVDAVLIAGDTFDAFSPPAEAQRLLFETLTRFLRDGIKVVMIAGNHDSAPRMDAMAGILEIAGVHCIGAPPRDPDYAPLRIPSRDGGEVACIAGVPWIAERLTVEYDALFGEPGEALQHYAAQMERALGFYCAKFDPRAINVLLGHMFVSKSYVGKDSGERKLQIGDLFAVLGNTLPQSAQYIALGHVHKPQAVPDSPVRGASFYAGSLLQLDFGEAQQPKSVRIVEAHPGHPADSREVPVTRGTPLRDVHLKLDDLPQHTGMYDGEYLRVFVQADGVVPSLVQQVRDALPNAVDVVQARGDRAETPAAVASTRGLEPHELLARYYRETHGEEIPPDVMTLFNQLYQEAMHAPAEA